MWCLCALPVYAELFRGICGACAHYRYMRSYFAGYVVPVRITGICGAISRDMWCLCALPVYAELFSGIFGACAHYRYMRSYLAGYLVCLCALPVYAELFSGYVVPVCITGICGAISQDMWCLCALPVYAELFRRICGACAHYRYMRSYLAGYLVPVRITGICGAI
ncbi:Hypothetical predicted protein [Pelobates cultripes]|uniref:Uncharacterized protein n=1 Tax=Pelobates cultripes TaxID=61616 RepID=A0AAD1RK57_PELCU|nr:Hypothetical predicted protein [Pelobates cultripes]